MYYLLTSKKKQNVLATKDINETFDFIFKNKDAKVRELNHTAKPRIIDRRNFIIKFMKLTQDDERTFQLSEIMVNGKTNLLAFLVKINKKTEYDNWKELSSKTL
jgi:hypothetical protein